MPFFSFVITLVNVPAFAKTPLILITSIKNDASCSLSERAVYGDNEKINAIGGPIGQTHNGQEYGARGCLLSLKVSDWEKKFAHCSLVEFYQPEYDEQIHKPNEEGSEFMCRFTKTPDGFFTFDSFGRRGSWCEFTCQ